MKNKGFTLIELLAVIVILSLLALLAGTSVTKMVKESKEDLYDAQKNSIKAAAEIWGADNLDKLPNEGACVYITLQKLIDAGLLDNEIKDARTDTIIPTTTKIKITTTNKLTKYEVTDSVSGCTQV